MRQLDKSFIYRNNIDKCRFSRILKADQCELHFFFPKEAFEPIENSVDQGKHVDH